MWAKAPISARSGRDLAHVLGTEGHLVALRRLSVGKFSIDDAISLETLAQTGHGAGLDVHLHPVETALDDIPALALTEAEAIRLQQGQALVRQETADRPITALATFNSRPVALVEIDGTTIRPGARFQPLNTGVHDVDYRRPHRRARQGIRHCRQ